MFQDKTSPSAPFLRLLAAIAEALLGYVQESQAAPPSSATHSKTIESSTEEGTALRVRPARRRDDSTRGQIRAAIKAFGGAEFGSNEVQRAVPGVHIVEVRNHLAVLANLKEVTRLARGRYVSS